MGCSGRAMHFNSRFVDIWGIPQDKADGLNDAALHALQLAQAKAPERLLAILERIRARPDEERCDRVELADGRVLECHVMPQRIRGRRAGSVMRWRDVSEMHPTPA